MFAALRYHARLQLRPESKCLVQYPTEAQQLDNVLEAQKVIFNLIFNRFDYFLPPYLTYMLSSDTMHAGEGGGRWAIRYGPYRIHTAHTPGLIPTHPDLTG